MNIINNFKVVITVVLIILILVIIRAFSANHFANDAKRLAEPSVIRTNIITPEQIKNLSGVKLIINLDEETERTNDQGIELVNIPVDSILNNNRLNTIRKHDGPVLLVSSETAVSARIWMVLSQMGYKNIYILTNYADNEVFKYNFQPDTLVRPEL
jgi:rhodanese-related sulfurtransferase